LQTEGSQLQAIELFAIKNESKPPRTLASAETFEFVLPDGAQIEGADAQAPNGQPISVKPSPTKQKNHYAFSFAIKPGESRFQISYHMPYSGKASFSPRLTRNFDHYVLVLPASIKFTPSDAKQFQAMSDQPGSNVQVSMRAQAGQDLSFAIAGTGTVPDEQAAAQGQGGASNGAPMGAPAGDDTRPGGGLGKPIDAPDGLAKFRWYILGALLTILVGGGIWTHERSKQMEEAAVPLAAEPERVMPQPHADVLTQAAPANLLLAALKEELFQLEIEHQEGKLTVEEYGKARAAIEQTLQRALVRRRS
jgi:hypothetical protein